MDRERDQLGSGVDAKLLADVLAMVVYREDAQVQVSCDLAACLAFRQKVQDFLFPARQDVIDGRF